ncbi:hypothetical protein [Phaffia rhodozyma]|uniref:Uncharacterized protein n=1 Tax=Phaffia rhodozyma TaxID=264483 RepID=A0A0F7SNV1_PHARH|nr:hypothetical protein [Phaffia rhodozyma]
MGRRTHSGNSSLRTNTSSSSSSSSDGPSRTLRSILTAKLARGVIESLVHVMVFESSCSPADQTRSFEETMTRMIDRFDSKDVRVQRSLSRLLKIFWIEQKRIDAALHSFSSTAASGSTSTGRPPHVPVVFPRSRSNIPLPMSNQARAAGAGDANTTTNPLIPPHRFIPLVNRGSTSRPLGAVSFLDRARPRSRPTIPTNGPTFSDFFSENDEHDDDDDDENGEDDEFGLREETDPIDLISDPTGDHRTPVDTGLDSHHWGFAPDDDGDDEDQEEEDIDHGWVHTGNVNEDESEEDEDDDDGDYRPSVGVGRSESNGIADEETDEPPPFSRARRFTDLLRPSAGLRTGLLRTGGPLGIRASSRDLGLRRLGSLNYIIGDEDENENDDDEDDADGGIDTAIIIGQEGGNDLDRTLTSRTRQTLGSRPNTFVRPRRAPPGPTAPLEEHYQYASYIRDMAVSDDPLVAGRARSPLPSLSSSWMSIIQHLAPTSTSRPSPSPTLPASSSSIQPSSNILPASDVNTETITTTSSDPPADLPARSAPALGSLNTSELRLNPEERNEFEDASAERRAQSRFGREDRVRS